ncbi:MAG: zinc dependent phospholipase C family protein [Deltaproteobacteria bacterium]|nr:zinc dependent phospholipase C family protein [Deltaproteobacteria bacterium]
MAETLLHVTLADEVLKNNSSSTLKPLLQKHHHDYILGAIIYDLSYFENLLLNGVRKLRKQNIHYSKSGQILHEQYGHLITVDAVVNAASDSEKAMTCGMITHFAADIIFHKEIEIMVSENPSETHSSIEDEMALHVHYELLGHSGVGTGYSFDAFNIKLSMKLENFYNNLIAPYPLKDMFEKKIKAQLRSLRLYGELNSFPFAPWVKTLADDNFKLAKKSLELTQKSLTLSNQLIENTQNFWNKKITENEFRNSFPLIKMSDGKPVTADENEK